MSPLKSPTASASNNNEKKGIVGGVNSLASQLAATLSISKPSADTNKKNLFAPEEETDDNHSAPGNNNTNETNGDNEDLTAGRAYREIYLNPTEDDLIHIIQPLFDKRVELGHGETVFELGSGDDSTPSNLTASEFEICYKTLELACTAINCDITLLTPPNPNKEVHQEDNTQSSGVSGHVLIRRKPDKPEDFLEIRVAVVGNVDAGKSTLLGVLTKGVLDDGRGKSRLNLFKHKHEIESGRTSAVGLEILGFNSKGLPILPTDQRKLSWEDICQSASKVLSFIDLAGHERYLKTTMFGITGCAPNFAMLMIGANAGIIGMTKEHLGLALALSVPVLVVVTKIDMCPPNILEQTLTQLTKILKSSGCRKIPIFVKNMEEVVVTAGNFVSERVCPIFQISNVTGEGLDLLKQFLNLLPFTGNYDDKLPVQFQITDTFSVPFVGTVVSGVMSSGTVHVGDQLMIGPDSLGHFNLTTVKSIHRKRINVPVARAGQSTSFALKKIKRKDIRKGMVMLSKDLDPPPQACYTFEAEVLVLNHSTTIGRKYQAMVHCGPIRQTARILNMDRDVLRTGDRATVIFQFLVRPEYIIPGTKLIFREGKTKGIGKIVRSLPLKPS